MTNEIHKRSTRYLVAPLIAIALAVTLSACGDSVESGEVIERKHTPAGMVPVTTNLCSGNPVRCVPTTNWIFQNEKWELRLRDCDARNDRGKCRTEWRSASETEYDSPESAVGQIWPPK